jgi:hypothetical protein
VGGFFFCEMYYVQYVLVVSVFLLFKVAFVEFKPNFKWWFFSLCFFIFFISWLARLSYNRTKTMNWVKVQNVDWYDLTRNIKQAIWILYTCLVLDCLSSCDQYTTKPAHVTSIQPNLHMWPVYNQTFTCDQYTTKPAHAQEKVAYKTGDLLKEV